MRSRGWCERGEIEEEANTEVTPDQGEAERQAQLPASLKKRTALKSI